jgi:hypothetical protein
MTPRSTAWLVYGAFLLYWWIAAVIALVRSRDPEWRPSALAQFERSLGIHLSTRGYVRIIFIAAILVTLSALWLPGLWASILEGHR